MAGISVAEQEAGVERRLLQVEENFITASPLDCCVVEVAVQDLGAWVVKFRENGVIFNRKDLIFPGAVQPDAGISFSSYEALCDMASGTCSLEELRARGSAQTFHRDEAFTPGLGRLFFTLQNRDSYPLSPSASASAAVNASGIGGAASPFQRPPLLDPASASAYTAAIPNSVIKAGWCYKKRDIIMGWRCRYMQVLPGRVEYFRDEHDVIPRGVIPLLGADVKGPKRCAVNGNEEHWSLTIEPKHKDKQFKLASLRTGEEGLVETAAWIQALVLASRAASDPEGASAASPLTPASASASSSMGQAAGLPTTAPVAAGTAATTGGAMASPSSSSQQQQPTRRLRRSIIGSMLSAVHAHQQNRSAQQHLRSGAGATSTTTATAVPGTSAAGGSDGTGRPPHSQLLQSSPQAPHVLTRETSDDAFVYRDAKWGVRVSGRDADAAEAGSAASGVKQGLRGLSEDLGLPALALPLCLAALAAGIIAGVTSYLYSASRLHSYYQEDGSIGT